MNLLMKYLIDRKMRPSSYYEFGDTCPCCGETCCDQSEYVDVGVGMAQVTYDMQCWNCGARGGNVDRDVKWYVPDDEGGYRPYLFPAMPEPRSQSIQGVLDRDDSDQRMFGPALREEVTPEEEVASPGERESFIPVSLPAPYLDLQFNDF